MTSKQTVQEFLSLTGNYSSVNRTGVTKIRETHETISCEDSSNRLSSKTLDLVAEKLNLQNTTEDRDYLKHCVENVDEESAVRDLFRFFQNKQTNRNRPVRRSAASNIDVQSVTQINTIDTTTVDNIESVSKLVCSIYIKQKSPVVDEFIREFFFKEIPPTSGQISRYRLISN